MHEAPNSGVANTAACMRAAWWCLLLLVALCVYAPMPVAPTAGPHAPQRSTAIRTAATSTRFIRRGLVYHAPLPPMPPMQCITAAASRVARLVLNAYAWACLCRCTAANAHAPCYAAGCSHGWYAGAACGWHAHNSHSHHRRQATAPTWARDAYGDWLGVAGPSLTAWAKRPSNKIPIQGKHAAAVQQVSSWAACAAAPCPHAMPCRCHTPGNATAQVSAQEAMLTPMGAVLAMATWGSAHSLSCKGLPRVWCRFPLCTGACALLRGCLQVRRGVCACCNLLHPHIRPPAVCAFQLPCPSICTTSQGQQPTTMHSPRRAALLLVLLLLGAHAFSLDAQRVLQP